MKTSTAVVSSNYTVAASLVILVVGATAIVQVARNASARSENKEDDWENAVLALPKNVTNLAADRTHTGVTSTNDVSAAGRTEQGDTATAAIIAEQESRFPWEPLDLDLDDGRRRMAGTVGYIATRTINKQQIPVPSKIERGDGDARSQQVSTGIINPRDFIASMTFASSSLRPPSCPCCY
jgi:hypothetical protein